MFKITVLDRLDGPHEVQINGITHPFDRCLTPYEAHERAHDLAEQFKAMGEEVDVRTIVVLP